MKRLLAVLSVLVLAGCVDDVDEPDLPEAEPERETGIFRIGASGIESVNELDGVTIDGDQIHFDWLHTYMEDTARIFFLESDGNVSYERRYHIEIDQIYRDEQGEARVASSICFTTAGFDSPVAPLALATGAAYDAEGFPPLPISWGGYAHSSPNWATQRPLQPLFLDGLVVVAGISGIQTIQWDDEDHFEARVTVDGDYRLIELPEIPMYCGPEAARFEQSTAKIPGRVVDGGEFALDSPYGAHGCATHTPTGEGRGIGTIAINGDEIRFDGTEAIELNARGIADARISVEQWEGNLLWGLFGWPDSTLCR